MNNQTETAQSVYSKLNQPSIIANIKESMQFYIEDNNQQMAESMRLMLERIQETNK